MKKNRFTLGEIGQNLLGCFDAMLLMPSTSMRFSKDYEGMVRSFFVPVIVFPLSILPALLRTDFAPGIETMALPFYSLKVWLSLGVFLAIMSYVVRETGRKSHFYQFVTAYNWLALPSALIFLPALWMAANGNAKEATALITCLTFYCYGFTAFAAASVLRMPIELGISIVVLAVGIDHGAANVMGWIQSAAL